MRLDVTLGEMRREVQIEAGLSTAAGHSAFSKDRIDQMLNRMQRMMLKSADWPSQKRTHEFILTANSNTYLASNLPSGMTLTSINTIHVQYGTDWLPLSRGIGAREWSEYSASQRTLPVRRWDIINAGMTAVEFWPIASTDQTLRIIGRVVGADMTDDADTPSVDGDVLVLRVAAQIMGRDNKADAALLLQQAKDLEDSIMKDLGSVTAENVNLAGRAEKRLRPGIDYIPPTA